MLTATVTPGFEVKDGVAVSAADMRAMARPNVSVSGSVGTADLENGSVTWLKLSSDFLGTPSLSTALADDDRILFHDTSENVAAVMTVGVFGGQLIGVLPTYTAFENFTGDKIAFYRSASQAGGNMVPAVFAEQLVEQAPTLTTVDDADWVGVVDISAADGSRFAKVALSNLLTNKISAGTYLLPTSIKVDEKGRVTEILSTNRGQRTDATVEGYQIAMPSAAGYANATSNAHGLGSKPKIVVVQLICTDAGGDAGYAQNDVIGIDAVAFDTGASDYAPHYVVFSEAADIKVCAPTGTAYIAHKSTGADATFTPSKWKWMMSATR